MTTPIDRREVGRASIQRRRRFERKCQECGKPFVGYNTRLFCSQRCQKRDYRRRSRES